MLRGFQPRFQPTGFQPVVVEFGKCIGAYLNAINLIGECKFDEAKDALNEAIKWNQVYWREADMPVGHHITEECAIAAKPLLEAIKVAEMYHEARSLVNQQKISEARGKIALLLVFHSQTNFVVSIENLNQHLNQRKGKPINYSKYAKKTADFYAHVAQRLLASISDSG